jgi:PKD repeat protein
LTYTLGGIDAASFGIDSGTGQLKTSAPLDYETKTTYSVIATVSDGQLTDSINITINVTDINENNAPVFTEGERTSRSIAENTSAGEKIGEPVVATDLLVKISVNLWKRWHRLHQRYNICH